MEKSNNSTLPAPIPFNNSEFIIHASSAKENQDFDSDFDYDDT